MLNGVREMTAEQVPELLGELEVVRATAMMRLTAPAPVPQCGELLNIQAAAKRMGVSTDYLYRHAEEFPFTRRIGRKLLFHSGGINQYNNRTRR